MNSLTNHTRINNSTASFQRRVTISGLLLKHTKWENFHRCDIRAACNSTASLIFEWFTKTILRGILRTENNNSLVPNRMSCDYFLFNSRLNAWTFEIPSLLFVSAKAHCQCWNNLFNNCFSNIKLKPSSSPCNIYNIVTRAAMLLTMDYPPHCTLIFGRSACLVQHAIDS